MSKIDSDGVSRRRLFERSAVAASAIPLLTSFTEKGEAAQAPRPLAQWGTGPIRVILITAFHPYERGPFFDLFDSFGKEITWTHVEHPAAEVFFDPALAEPWDVFVLFDAFAGRERRTRPDGTVETVYTEPSLKLQQGTKALLQKGKGFVFFHHAIASWVQTWPQYVEIMGAAADWGAPLKNIRGKDYPISGYYPGQQQHITVVDKTHPIVQGLGDSFDIVDETYLCPMFEDSVHPLLRTNAVPKAENFPLQLKRDPKWSHPPGSNMTAWVKAAEKSPVAYIQHGHDHLAWENPAFRTLMMNAIRWAASKEAKDWAAAHPQKIFA